MMCVVQIILTTVPCLGVGSRPETWQASFSALDSGSKGPGSSPQAGLC